MAVGDVETRRAQHIKGLIKSSDLSADEWERIKAHDAMLEDEDGA